MIGILPFLPHIAPPLTPSTLPPKIAYDAIIGSIGHLDAVLTSLTPPNLLLFRQLMGYMHTVELYSAASLKVAEALHSAGPSAVAIADVAVAVSNCSAAPTDTPAGCPAVELRLTRLLRALAAYGVFVETGSTNHWRNTLLSEYLRGDHPDSLRAIVLQFGGVQFRMMSELPTTILTGEASFHRVHGQEFWSYYEAHPDDHGIFDTTMASLGRLGGADAAIANDVPWSSIVDALVDVGGGYGEMLSTILRAHPAIEKGTVVDLLPVVDRANALWRKGRFTKYPARDGFVTAPGDFRPAEDKALSARVDLIPGDMFNASTLVSVVNSLERAHRVKMAYPLGDSAAALYKCSHVAAPRHGYLLRDILHDWPDEDCVRILSSIRANMRANETVCYGSDGSKVVKPAPVGHAYKDRVFIVGRVLVPGTSFINSMGSNDADMVMLGAFGTTAGERTIPHFTSLLDAAGLDLVTVHRTRSHYSVLEAKAKATPAGWGYTGTSLRDPKPRAAGARDSSTASSSSPGAQPQAAEGEL